MRFIVVNVGTMRVLRKF